MTSQRDEIFVFLKALLVGFLDDISGDDITESSTIASLGMESLDFVDLQVEFGKKYRVVVPPSVFAGGKVLTIGDFVTHVQGLLNPPGAPAPAPARDAPPAAAPAPVLPV